VADPSEYLKTQRPAGPLAPFCVKGLRDLFHFFDLPELVDQMLKLHQGRVLSSEQVWTLVVGQAALGWGWTAPNPPVGCVILDAQNRLLGWGFHKKAGGPHAEIEALACVFGGEPLQVNAQGDWALPNDLSILKGAKVFTSLEPCAFRGRTPSCAETLAKLPVAQIWVMHKDPHPKVNGQGMEILRRAGIAAKFIDELGEGTFLNSTNRISEPIERAIKLNSFLLSGFLNQVQKNRPLVIGKIAISLDGFYALDTGESQWITSERSRALARMLRGASDILFTTSRTLLKDDPIMDARQTVFATKPRRLWVWDPNGHFIFRVAERVSKGEPLPKCLQAYPQESILFFSDAPITFSKGLKISEGTLARLPGCELESKIHESAGSAVWVEAGGAFMSELLQRKLFNQLWLFSGPMLLGGKRGMGWTKDLEIRSLSSALRLRPIHARLLDEDLIQLLEFDEYFCSFGR
jgi:diaminohydroxyphosphoribosylaminopyrimidine deaminase/5-amino-6-(5-phosphoribosylamino)uracil reductase